MRSYGRQIWVAHMKTTLEIEDRLSREPSGRMVLRRIRRIAAELAPTPLAGCISHLLQPMRHTIRLFDDGVYRLGHLGDL